MKTQCIRTCDVASSKIAQGKEFLHMSVYNENRWISNRQPNDANHDPKQNKQMYIPQKEGHNEIQRRKK